MGNCCNSTKNSSVIQTMEKPQNNNLKIQSKNEIDQNHDKETIQPKDRSDIVIKNNSLKSQNEKKLSEKNDPKQNNPEKCHKNTENQNIVVEKMTVKTVENNNIHPVNDNKCPAMESNNIINNQIINIADNSGELFPYEQSELENRMHIGNNFSNGKHVAPKMEYIMSENSDAGNNLIYLVERNLHDLRREFLDKESVKIFFSLFSEKKYLYEDENSYNKIKDIRGDIQDFVRRLLELHKIKLIKITNKTTLEFDDYKVECNQLDDRDMDYFLPIFFFEFSLYPVSFIRNSKLKKIYFANSMKYIKENKSESKAIVPNYKDLSIIYSCNERNISIINRVMHHQFFLFIYFVDDHRYLNEENWESLNIEGFKYGTNDHQIDYAKHGFLNYISTQEMEEDKAEIFTHMFNFPIEAFEVSDKIIVKKVMYLVSYLQKFDPRGFGGENFWIVLREMRKNFQTKFFKRD